MKQNKKKIVYKVSKKEKNIRLAKEKKKKK